MRFRGDSGAPPTPGRSHYGIFLPAFISALLLLLAQPPFRLVLLPFVALVPLAVALEPEADGEAGEGTDLDALLAGVVFGTVHFGVLLFWIPVTLSPHFSWGVPAYGLLLLILACLMGVVTWTTRRLRRGPGPLQGLPLPLAFAVAWVAMEWLRGNLPLGMAWPWMGISLGLTPLPDLLGLAEWVGESGVAFWLALLNGLVAEALLRASSARTWMLVLLVFLGPALLGMVRARSLELEEGPRVAVVGTHVPGALKSTPRAASREALVQVRTHVASLTDAGGVAGSSPRGSQASDSPSPSGRSHVFEVDLVVLPEATVALPLWSGEAALFRDRLTALARKLDGALVVGALDRKGDEGDGGKVGAPAPRPPPLVNAAFLVTPRGPISEPYHKIRLVPGMEALPRFLPPALSRGLFGSPSRSRPGSTPDPPTREAGVQREFFARGDEARVVRWRGWSYGPLICYESLFGGLARRQARNGADILVNVTSDVWFGTPGAGLGAPGLRQHASHMVLRALETRTPVARAANGGFSFILDPLGRVVGAEVGPGGGSVAAVVPLWRGETLFARTGDLVGPASALLALGLLLVGAFVPRARRTPSGK